MTGSVLAPSSPQSRWNSLRIQFMGVVFALSFFPNMALALMMSQGKIGRALLVWTLLVGLLCAALAYVLSGVFLRPLTRLQSEAEVGTFGVQLGDDPLEVRELRSAFVGLLKRLEVEQLRRHAFMATLVHDLKTPLIATGNLTQILVAEGLSAAERAEVGEQMLSENGRLLRLVQQMADAHRFERDNLTLSMQPIEAREVLLRLEQRLRTRATDLGLHLSVEGEAQLLADASALERALENVCENALRYARTSIELRAFTLRQTREVLLSISDDGPGLSAPLEELAQPFNAQPVAIAGQQYTAGTAGLGLFIARRVAQAHGGTLQVTHEAGRTTFNFRLPQGAVPAGEQA